MSALDREAVVRPLTRERDRALGHGLAERRVRRIARHRRVAVAHVDRRPELGQAVDDGVVRPGRNEHAQATVRSASDDGRGERGVPAARDREVARLLGTGEARLLGDEEADHEAHEMPRLVRATHVDRLVLHPHLAPEPLGERIAPLERRLREAVSVDRGDGLVELFDEVDVIRVAHPVRAAEVVRVEQLPVADEGVRLVVAAGELDVGRVELADHDVIDVVGPGARAAERERLVGGRAEAAPGADDGGRQRAHAGTACTAALTSRIAASHSGTRSRSPRQNDCSRRAVKSSIETPCCSTHVK
jgi:hypothetical protein